MQIFRTQSTSCTFCQGVSFTDILQFVTVDQFHFTKFQDTGAATYSWNYKRIIFYCL